MQKQTGRSWVVHKQIGRWVAGDGSCKNRQGGGWPVMGRAETDRAVMGHAETDRAVTGRAETDREVGGRWPVMGRTHGKDESSLS